VCITCDVTPRSQVGTQPQISFRYIIGIYDVDSVTGPFNLFKNSAFAESAISFPVVSFVFGLLLFIVGACTLSTDVPSHLFSPMLSAISAVLPFIPSWIPTSVKNVRYAQIVERYLQGTPQLSLSLHFMRAAVLVASLHLQERERRPASIPTSRTKLEARSTGPRRIQRILKTISESMRLRT
jgi:hypothetical protein